MYIATYNIQSGGNSRLTMALETMKTMNIDLGLFTEKKLITELHTLSSCGYEVSATEAKNTHQKPYERREIQRRRETIMRYAEARIIYGKCMSSQK